MDNLHPLTEIIEKRRQGIISGVCSVCSANELVIEAAMEKADEEGQRVLIEATANQVNQFGGYTGMTPGKFRDFVFSIADGIAFPRERVILGGDHLGPLTWKGMESAKAMANAAELVREYVKAGFSKIHLDTSMRLGDDRMDRQLDVELVAARGAFLCRAAEEAYRELKEEDHKKASPVYVVGSEVPVPGGSKNVEELTVTDPTDFVETVEAYRKEFRKSDLEEAYMRVIAVVVQPGVEFGDEFVAAYDREKARDLTAALKQYPDLVFEAHSTDYQTAEHLRQMVEDGFGVLKVGPALTFALREALFALNLMEEELLKIKSGLVPSQFIKTLESEMIREPKHWQGYYRGSEPEQSLSRKYSLLDRCRYYLPNPGVKASMERLFNNLTLTGIPLSLLSQYMPVQYKKVREGRLDLNPRALAKDRVKGAIEDYGYATRPRSPGSGA